MPGDGSIKTFPEILETLANAGFTGWLVIEAEQDPAKANPLQYAKMARAFLKQQSGVVKNDRHGEERDLLQLLHVHRRPAAQTTRPTPRSSSTTSKALAEMGYKGFDVHIARARRR